MGVLDGKVALVTGASRGIGAEIARRFAAEGARVAVAARTADPSQSRLEGTIHETVESIRSAGGEAEAFAVDLSNRDQRERLADDVRERLGPVDVLVNNAAVTFFIPVGEFPPKRMDLMLEVQVVTPFHLAQLVLPGMRERKQGWILNISSLAAVHPPVPPPHNRRVAGGTVYGMCKAAVERFTTGLAAEEYANGIVVNALSPNRVVPTPGTLFHHLVTDDTDPAYVEPPEVMAEAALVLCSGDPHSLSGRVTYSQTLLDELGVRS